MNISVDVGSVYVRRVGDGSLSEEAFDRARLLRDVRRGALNTLTEEQCHDVVSYVVLQLQNNIDNVAVALEKGERGGPGEVRFSITDAQIGQAVEQAMRLRGHRLSHVLYALSTLGRRDREGRTGFETAADVLEWIGRPENYPRVNTEVVVADSRASVAWTPPAGAPPKPKWVIKKDLSSRRVYDHEEFLGDIRRAMTGRRDAASLTLQIAKWVLWNLAGQSMVLSTQLGAGVISGLRRIDDIAYLRWVAVEKNVQSIPELAAEARALLETPSPRLLFVESMADV